VNWGVNGIAGGNAASGTISSAGMYNAVRTYLLLQMWELRLPASQITVTSDIAVGISAASTSVELAAKQHFAATLTSAGQPDTTIRWKPSGNSCASACG